MKKEVDRLQTLIDPKNIDHVIRLKKKKSKAQENQIYLLRLGLGTPYDLKRGLGICQVSRLGLCTPSS